ncbi:alanine racemase [Endobacter medicaginis]|uniref:Alanine racemase n=1 Tax=Endobacter medicaginis TaxID=1181271 RepID=A0A850NXX0_9PROT|nr:alanine racemase [Endobacter medicaginis]MBB3173839.1 alanine racemase [Endobacter medicaginis]MCX5477057.1 alanine racemase [Endobacter medicaginis]NVN30747.1 alanine racemase [Endobacter medicaginis]
MPRAAPDPALLDEKETRVSAVSGVLEIDLGAIAANWRTLAQRAPGAEMAAVVKADAYGLGARRVVPALRACGARSFFVAQLGEALEIVDLIGDGAALYVLNGLMPGLEGACAEAGIRPVLNSLDQLDAWAAEGRRRGRDLPAALQLDSGMSRLGLSPDELQRLRLRLDAQDGDTSPLDGVRITLVMSHFACAEIPEHPANAAQAAAFEHALSGLSAILPDVPRSLANSSGIFLGPAVQYELCRPGIALYGGNPTPGWPNPMRPVVRLYGRVIQTRVVPEGAAVGYGATWRTAQASRIATVGIGYADGFLRSNSNRGHLVWPERPGIALPIVGIVSMDCLTVDISALGHQELPAGTALELIGPQRSLDAVAQSAGTIGYELLTGLGRRYQRIYLDAEEQNSCG